ncbi:MAG: hypothetical protein HN948_02515 [Clostridia bacterium]|nr:hypothetical protein [Clostridia bacterium]MBT7121864.1 hypothetical protein [Clostridia bacterium]
MARKKLFGKGVYVDDSNYESAKEIVDSYDADIQVEDELDIPKEKRTGTRGKLAIALSVVIIILMIIMLSVGVI